jgi:pyruvate kinase
MRKIKIVATIGPKTSSASFIKKLGNAGVDIFRLNGSHNTLKWHLDTIKRIKKCFLNKPILFDVPGRKVRTKNINLDIKIIKNKVYNISNFPEDINVTNQIFFDLIKKNQIIYADDGTLSFKVISINLKKKFSSIKALNNGYLKNSKGINIPGSDYKGSKLNKKDYEYLSFAKDSGVDFIGISFVESAQHINTIKKYIGNNPKIVSKIESMLGIKNLTEITANSDCLMIDRGDLSIETLDNSIALSQKKIINTSNKFCKPVIIATELLNNMIENRFPTRSEVSDIGNSVIDGASALMLSGETATGLFPIESVKTMKTIIEDTEKAIEIKNLNVKNDELSSPSAEAIDLLCKNTGVSKVIAITRSGFAARALSLRSINVPIIAISDDKKNSKSFNILPGVTGIFYTKKFEKTNLDFFKKVLKFLFDQKHIVIKDKILVTAVAYPSSGNRMNLIQIHSIKDLKKLLNWK